MKVFQYQIDPSFPLFFLVAATDSVHARNLLQITDGEFNRHATLCQNTELCATAIAMPDTVLYRRDDESLQEIPEGETPVTLHLEEILRSTRVA